MGSKRKNKKWSDTEDLYLLHCATNLGNRNAMSFACDYLGRSRASCVTRFTKVKKKYANQNIPALLGFIPSGHHMNIGFHEFDSLRGKSTCRTENEKNECDGLFGSECHRLNSVITTLNNNLSFNEKRIISLEGQLDSAHKRIKDVPLLQSKVQLLEYATSKQGVEEKDNKIKFLEAQIRGLETNVKKLTTESQEDTHAKANVWLKKQIKNKDVEIMDLLRQVAHLSGKINGDGEKKYEYITEDEVEGFMAANGLTNKMKTHSIPPIQFGGCEK